MVSYKQYLEKSPALESKLKSSYEALLSVIYGEENAITQGGGDNSLNDNDLEFLFLEVYQIVSIINSSLDVRTSRNMLSVYQRFFKEGELTPQQIEQIDSQLNGGKAKVAVFCGLPREIVNNEDEDPMVVEPPTNVVYDVETRTIDPEKLKSNPITYVPSGTTSEDSAIANWTLNCSKGELYPDGNLWCCLGVFNLNDGSFVSWDKPFMVKDSEISTIKSMYDYTVINLDFRLMFSSYLAYRVASQTW